MAYQKQQPVPPKERHISTDESFINDFKDKRPGFMVFFMNDATPVNCDILRTGRYALAVKTHEDPAVNRQSRFILIFKHAIRAIEPMPPEK